MKKIYLTFIVSLGLLVAIAQDIHYTQFYNSPLLLNPALTGLVPNGGMYRIGIHYRNQWFTGVNNGFFSSPFQTPSIYGDAPIRVFKNDAVGVGAVIFADFAGAGSMATYSGVLSGSYIKGLGKDHNHQLSAGFQVGYTQLRIRQDNLHWASQAVNNEFQTNLPAGVNLSPNVGYVNLNFGLMYYGRLTEKLDMYLGGAFFNATTPKYNLGAAEAQKNLYFRWNISGGMDVKLGKDKRFHLLPSALFMRQSTADQLNIGMGLGYDITREANLVLGGYCRVNNLTNNQVQADAGIAYVGLDVKGFKLGASYDFTASKFRQAGPGVGGLEISLTYTGRAKNYDLRQIMFCPRF